VVEFENNDRRNVLSYEGRLKYRQLDRKIILTHVYFAPPLTGFYWNWVSALVKETRMMVLYQLVKKVLRWV